MKKTDKITGNASLAESLERDLLQQYGPMLTGDSLKKALGYPSMDALRQAIFRKTVPVPIFRLKNRRGSFALVKDVANWLAVEREKVFQDEDSLMTNKGED